MASSSLHNLSCKIFSDLEDAEKKKLTRRDRFLAKIDTVTPWSQLHAVIKPFDPKLRGAGRPPICLAHMLRMYVALQCFGLSERALDRLRRIQHHQVVVNDTQPVTGLSTIGQEHTAILAALTIKKPSLNTQLTLL